MVIYDESGERLDSYDPDAGRVRIEEKDVLHRWVVDAEEEGEFATVAEYPDTGGKDVEWRVTKPEEGHWETVDAETDEAVADFDGAIPEDLPHDVETPDIWEYGVYVPYTAEELEQMEADKADAQAQAARTAQLAVAAQLAVMSLDLTDEQAMEVSTLYPDWEVGGLYKTGDIRRYGGALWRALQDSTGEAQYPPDAYTAGWKRIGEPDGSGVFPWVQPLGATDAYKKGDVVTHGGKTWVSDIDANVWEPGVYGWSEQSGGSEGPDEPQGAQEWEQPTGAHDAYSVGDEVTHDGHLWRSTADGNVWEPGTVGAPWEDLGAVE